MTKQITPFDFKVLRKGLKMGDIAILSGRTGFSAVTIQTALKGDSITEASEIIIPEALKLVKENALEADRIYKAGKEAFDRKKKQGAL